MSNALCEKIGHFRCWHYSTRVSDHKVVVLQLDFDLHKVCYPFKFNSSWLAVEDFNSLITSQWDSLHSVVPAHYSPFQSLLFKLSKLHRVVSTWELDEKKKGEDTLCTIEDEIRTIDGDPEGGCFFPL